MLVIRPEQLEALSQYMRRQFATRMIVAMRQAFPEKLKEVFDDDLRGTITDGIEAARGYGITDEADVEGYLWYVIEFGADFGSTPQTAWAEQILVRQELAGAEKMRAIEDYYLFDRGMHNHG